MSVFDKETFLNTEVKGASETKYTPVPVGEHKGAYIDDLGLDTYKDKNTGDEVPILIVTWHIPNEALAKTLGMDKVTVQDRMFLDVDASGNILFGPNKNIRLGKTREATGQNDPKKQWNFNMLRGAGPCDLKISHKFDNNGEGPFARIDRVVRSA